MRDLLTIHKQPLPVFDAQSDILTIQVPQGAKILKIARQFPEFSEPCVWYACNPAMSTETIMILVVGTGHAFPECVLDDYLGTELFHGGSLVLHFFLMRG